MASSRVPGGSYGGVAAGQSIYDVSAKPHTAVGSRLPMGDRVFYYGKVAATVAAGNVLSSDVSIAGPVLLGDAACVAITSANRKLGRLVGEEDKAITAALAVGDRGVGITESGTALDNVTAHMLKDGYLLLTDSTATTGMDQIYKIRDNTAASSDVVEILLYDEIRTATIDAATDVAVMCSPFMNLIGSTLDGDEAYSGVPLVANTTATPYMWIQTWGPSLITLYTGNTTGVGGYGLIPTTTAGQVSPSAAGTVGIVAFGLTDSGANNDAVLAMLRLYP